MGEVTFEVFLFVGKSIFTQSLLNQIFCPKISEAKEERKKEGETTMQTNDWDTPLMNSPFICLFFPFYLFSISIVHLSICVFVFFACFDGEYGWLFAYLFVCLRVLIENMVASLFVYLFVCLFCFWLWMCFVTCLIFNNNYFLALGASEKITK